MSYYVCISKHGTQYSFLKIDIQRALGAFFNWSTLFSFGLTRPGQVLTELGYMQVMILDSIGIGVVTNPAHSVIFR